MDGAAKAIRAIWEADSLRGRFARGTLWSLGGAVVAQGSALASSVIAARLLGPELFGQYGIVQSTVGMLGVFAGLGLGVTSTRYVAELRCRDPERAGRIIALTSITTIILGGLLALALVNYASVLAARTLSAPWLAGELRIASVLLFLNAFNGAQIGALSGFEAFQTIARINLARGLVTFPLTVGFVLQWQMPGALWALVVSAALTCLLSQLSLRRHCVSSGIHPRLSLAWSERRVLWAFSTPALLSGAMVGPVSWAANAMLVNQSGGYVEMGVFSAANQWRVALLFLPSLVGQVATPMLASLQDAGGGRLARKLLFSSMLTNAVLTLPPVLVLLSCSEWVMSLYGSDFLGRGHVLAILGLSAALLAVQTPVGNLVVAFGRMWAGFLMNAAWAACLLATTYVLLGFGWGALALASAYVTAYLAHALWTFWFASALLRRSHTSSTTATTGVAALV